MPFTLAHPAAVVAFRRFCPRHFDYPALVIGSLLPDFAYAIDDLNKFSITMSRICGSITENLTMIRDSWDWDDFSHSFPGSIVFCLPLGLLVLKTFVFLRSALVRTLPNPHRDALLTLCGRHDCSILKASYSLLVGAWTHSAWDSLTNVDRFLGQHWKAFRYQMEIGPTRIEVYRLFWLLSSVGGMVILGIAYFRFLRRQRISGWFYQQGEMRFYCVWFAVFSIAAIVAARWTDKFERFAGSTGTKLAFLHRFAGYWLAITCLCILFVTCFVKWQECKGNQRKAQ